MAINYHKIRNGITLKATSAPGTPENGDVYYDSTSNLFEFYQNGSYITIPSSSGFATNTLNNLGLTGYVYANGAGSATASTTVPTSALSGSINLTSQVSGVLPIANGGTDNGSLAVTAGGVIYTDGTKFQNSGAGTTGQVLTSNGSSAPSFQGVSVNNLSFIPTSVQTFTQTAYYTFTTSSNIVAYAGATYTNNGSTFTVVYSTTGTTIVTYRSSGTAAPTLTASTLTYSAGGHGTPTGGTSNISYSSAAAGGAYVLPQTYTFTITGVAASATPGSTITWSNNGQIFTLLGYYYVAFSTVIILTGTGAPTSSGTLTAEGAGGFGNITYSAFTTNVQPLYLEVTVVGGGGGGGGAGSAVVNGGAGTASSFGSSVITANGGTGGTGGTTGAFGTGGAGGTATITAATQAVSIRTLSGGIGSGGATSGSDAPGTGGNGPLGGAGGAPGGPGNGTAAAANTGAGGGGAVGATAGAGGGGAGGFVEAIYYAPNSTISFAVGPGGSGGAGSTDTGGAGGSGQIIVRERYY